MTVPKHWPIGCVWLGRGGLTTAPVEELIGFHVAFGKTVPDISLNAVANRGYADGRWGVPVYAGDTLKTVSTVIGKRELSNGGQWVTHGFVGLPSPALLARRAAYGVRRAAEALPLGRASALPGKAMRRMDVWRGLR